jgi:hypothetical protein
VNLILVVGFIGRMADQGWLSDFTLLGRFAPRAGFVIVCQAFVRHCHAANGCRRRFDLSPSGERLIAQRPPLRMPPCAQLPSRERQWAWGGRAASGPPTSVVEPGGDAGRRGRAQGLAPGVVVPNAAVAIRRARADAPTLRVIEPSLRLGACLIDHEADDDRDQNSQAALP